MFWKKTVKTGQEQAAGAWIEFLNQLRVETLHKELTEQAGNLASAMGEIWSTTKNIHDLMESNRGGSKGMHGFIAERAECGVGNALKRIMGEEDSYLLLDDNGAVDFVRDGVNIQQKFVQAQHSLQAVLGHKNKYPDYQGKWQIPKDFYEDVLTLLNMSEEEANRLPLNGNLTRKAWKSVHDFFEKSNLCMDDIEASHFNYSEVQVNRIDETLLKEEQNIKKLDQDQREKAYKKSLPGVKEGIKTAAWSAATEGMTEFVLGITEKRKGGKKLKDFTEEDWKEITGSTGLGAVKGGIRGTSIYLLTNYTATPGAVASSMATASFCIAEQAYRFRNKKVTEIEFLEMTELIVLDAAVSALSSIMGQVLIPLPVLGAVIGNSVGQMMYQCVKETLSKKEIQLVKNFMEEQKKSDELLQKEYKQYLEELRRSLSLYLDMLDQAFSPDPGEALMGSVALAKAVGVPDDEVLDSRKKCNAFFLK